MAARPVRCVLFALVVAAGCADTETVRVYDEPKVERRAAREIPAEQKTYRTLAAMVPADAASESGVHWWFFKLSGPAPIVSKYEADFDKLFNSIRSSPDPDDPITWELPTGWKAEKPKEGGAFGRYATLKPSAEDAEIAVSQASGHVLSNSQRWWGQLWGKDKESEITSANLTDYVSQKVVKGRLLLRADMYGPNDPNKRPMMKNPHGEQ